VNPDFEPDAQTTGSESGYRSPSMQTAPGTADAKTGFFDYLEAIVRRKWLATGVFLGILGLTVLTITRSQTSYEATATMMLTAGNQGDIFGGSRTFLFPSQPNTGDCVTLLRTRIMAERVADSLPDSLELQPRTLQSMVVANSPGGAVVQVSATASSRQVAVAVANAYVDAYKDYDHEESKRDIASVMQFIDEQLEAVRGRLDAAERKLQEFRAERKLLAGIDAETQSLLGRQSALAAQYQQELLDAQVIQAELAQVQDQIEQEGRSIADVGGMASPLVASLRATLSQLEVEKVNLIVRGYDESSAQIRGLDRRIDSTRARLSIESQALLARRGATDPVARLGELLELALDLSTRVAVSKAKQEALMNIMSSYDAELANLPEDARAEASLVLDAETRRQQLSLFAERREQVRIQDAGRTPSVRPLDRALDARPIGTSVRSRLAFGLFLALALALGSVWTAEYLDTSIHGQRELERRGYSVLGTIPQLLSPGRGRDTEVTSHLITHTDVESSGAEAFRMLRTALAFATAERKVRTIAVTSPGPSEGKSTVAVNLASVLAQAGSRVLLVDADLRHPTLHTVFRRSKKPGMSDLVILNSSPDQAIFATGLDGLFCLPCGTIPPSPADLLTLTATGTLFKRLAGEYDFVVIDTPPVLVAADTPIIGTLADTTILVVRVGRTALDALGHARAAMLNAGVHLSGLVLNDVKRSGRYGRYYYYYYKYHYQYSKHKADAVQPGEETGNRESGAGAGPKTEA
jgi:succinoglycan biosynthesis transport protein ExoP